MWRYAVHPDKLNEFLHAYGPDGDWVRLFSGAAGYLGTELLRDRDEENCFITIDRWKSPVYFDRFLRTHQQAYQELDKRCEALTTHEEKLGSFSEQSSIEF